jgi:hypothetical protein
MGFSENVSRDPILDEQIHQIIRRKKDENLALKKLLNALEKAKQENSDKSKKN